MESERKNDIIDQIRKEKIKAKEHKRVEKEKRNLLRKSREKTINKIKQKENATLTAIETIAEERMRTIKNQFLDIDKLMAENESQDKEVE